MNTTKYFLFAALGVAAVLLLTSDRAKEMRDDIEDKAMKNAKKWQRKLGKLGNATGDRLAELRDLLGTEIEGLSDDARERLEAIVNGTTKTTAKMKKDLKSQVS